MLLAVLMLGLAASGLTAILRAVVQEVAPDRLLEKPLSCDLCMSFWSTIALVGLWCAEEPMPWIQAPLAICGAVGVSLLSVKAASRLSS